VRLPKIILSETDRKHQTDYLERLHFTKIILVSGQIVYF